MTEQQTTPVLNNIAVIKQFFEANGGRKVSMDEFKALTSQEREELANMIRAQQK